MCILIVRILHILESGVVVADICIVKMFVHLTCKCQPGFLLSVQIGSYVRCHFKFHKELQWKPLWNSFNSSTKIHITVSLLRIFVKTFAWLIWQSNGMILGSPLVTEYNIYLESKDSGGKVTLANILLVTFPSHDFWFTFMVFINSFTV